MIRRMLLVLPVVAGVLLVGTLAGAQEYSADMVSREGNKVTNMKIYIAQDKFRMEMTGSIMIMRKDLNLTWMVMPSDEMYMENPINLALIQKMSRDFSDEIERVPMGIEVIDGQNAEKFKVSYMDNGNVKTVYQWLRDQVPVKVEAEDQSWSTEYHNIEIGPQPADLFEPPADYEKFSIPSMGDIMKNIGNMVP